MHVNREGESKCAELAGLLLSYTRQVTLGMVCLQIKEYIHRDLAARNVLVSDEGLCKVHVHVGRPKDIIPQIIKNNKKVKESFQNN